MRIWNFIVETAESIPLVGIGIMAVIAFIVFFIVLQFARQLLAIIALPTTRTDRLVVGQPAEVKGTIAATEGAPIAHPDTGEPVVHYSVRLAALYAGADSDSSPVEETIDSHSEGAFGFEIQDEGGKVHVLHQTYLNELTKYKEKTYTRRELPESIKAQFPAFAEYTDTDAFKVITRWLPVGERVYATGEVVSAYQEDGQTTLLALFGGMGAQKDWQRRLLDLSPDKRPYAGEEKGVFASAERKTNNNATANKYILAFGGEGKILFKKVLQLLLALVIWLPLVLFVVAWAIGAD